MPHGIQGESLNDGTFYVVSSHKHTRQKNDACRAVFATKFGAPGWVRVLGGCGAGAGRECAS